MDLAVEGNPHRIPRFRALPSRLSGAGGTKNPVGLLATVFPEFIARDDQEHAPRGRQGSKRRVGAARRRSRGLGPARLDGPGARATVAIKVMRSGKMAAQARTGTSCRAHGKRSAQARSGKPGRRRQGLKPARGEMPQADRCAARKPGPAGETHHSQASLSAIRQSYAQLTMACSSPHSNPPSRYKPICRLA